MNHNNDKILTAQELDTNTYRSSAQQWSGKYPKLKERFIFGTIIVVCCILSVCIYAFARKYYIRKQKRKLIISNQDKVVTKNSSDLPSSELSLEADIEHPIQKN